MDKPYEMPPIGLEPVIWTHAPGGTPAAAVVTRVGRGAVSVLIFAPESRVGIPRDGVRFVGDPALARLVANDGGCWDYTPSHKLLLSLRRAAESRPK